MPEIISAADAPLIDEHVVRVLQVGAEDGGDDLGLVAEAVGNDGRSGRSVRRQVRIACSLGRPSRRKNEPGILPAAYIRSSTSTVSGKKSMPSRTPLAALAVTRTTVLADAGRRRRPGSAGRACRSRRSGSCRCRVIGPGHGDGVRHAYAPLSAASGAPFGAAGPVPSRRPPTAMRGPGDRRLTTDRRARSVSVCRETSGRRPLAVVA